MINWWWKRRARQRERKQRAESELEYSQELLEQSRKHTVSTLSQAAERNQFMSMFRQALSEGYEHERRQL